jgi:hypothetical protein
VGKRSAVRHRLNVVFDTSTLYTKRVDDLVSAAVADVIKTNSAHADIEIIWTIPQMVVDERENQMLEMAKTYVVALNKIERLLGTNWGVTEENLALHVDKAVRRRMDELGLCRQQLDAQRVEWKDIAKRAAQRLPPFEKGDAEKGFKDAVIAETFVQLAKDWIAADSRNKAILIAKDGLLKEWVTSQLPAGTRVRVLDLPGLQSEINILGSSVDEAFAAELVADAEKLFYIPGDKSTFFFAGSVTGKISEKYLQRINWLPEGGQKNAIKGVRVHPPVFLEKTSRRVKFSTKVTYSMETLVYPRVDADGNSQSPGLFGLGATGANNGPSQLLLAQAREASLSPDMRIFSQIKNSELESSVHKGAIEFNVIWDASLLRSKRLSTPELLDTEVQSDTWSPTDLV